MENGVMNRRLLSLYTHYSNFRYSLRPLVTPYGVVCTFEPVTLADDLVRGNMQVDKGLLCLCSYKLALGDILTSCVSECLRLVHIIGMSLTACQPAVGQFTQLQLLYCMGSVELTQWYANSK